MMHSTHCLNCDQPIESHQKYCAYCGQSTHIHRITAGHIIHEFFHAFTHTDKGIFHLLKWLALNPGKVAAEYVAGKRKKYFNPFTLLLLCMALSFFISSKTGVFVAQKADPKILAIIPPKKQQAYIALIDRSNTALGFVSKNYTNIIIAGLPFTIFFVWLFFRKRGRNFAEMFTALVFFSSFLISFSCIVIPIQYYYKSTPYLIYIFLLHILLNLAYYTWGFKNFLKYKSAIASAKIFLALLLGYIIWLAIIIYSMYYYIFRDKTNQMLWASWQQLF